MKLETANRRNRAQRRRVPVRGRLITVKRICQLGIKKGKNDR